QAGRYATKGLHDFGIRWQEHLSLYLRAGVCIPGEWLFGESGALGQYRQDDAARRASRRLIVSRSAHAAGGGDSLSAEPATVGPEGNEGGRRSRRCDQLQSQSLDGRL